MNINSDTTTPRLPVFHLLFLTPEGEQVPVEIAGPSLEEVVAFVEKRDGVTFVSEIKFS